jgi:hypothetical protein
MGSKSQRKKQRQARQQRQARKRQEKQKQRKQEGPRREREIQWKGEIPLPSNARHRERLSQQVPHAWTGESPLDVAVFDDAALAALPPDQVEQGAAIRAALMDALESRGDDALKRVSGIARSSPLTALS